MKTLMKTPEVAELLDVSPRMTIKLLRKWGVEMYADFGPGRGLGPRWLTSEVMEAAKKTAKPHRKSPAPRPRKRKRKHALDSDTILDDLFS